MNEKIKGEFASYQRLFSGVTGKDIDVKVIPRNEDAIGYTSDDGTIHLTEYHPVMSKMPPNKYPFFRKGVFVHEMLHQIFTNFKYTTKVAESIKNDVERRIFYMMSNIVEDPSIEYWAPTVVGGTALKALRFSILYIYENSPPLEESPSAFSQYVNALIQMGDMGLLKGRFTFDEAKATFAKTAALFNKGVCEANNKKRIEISKEIVEISRPLWEKEYKDQSKLADLLNELAKRGKSGTTGSGSGQNGDADAKPKENKKEKARKITIKKVSKEEYEDLKKNAKESDGSSDGDVTLIICDEEENDSSKSSSSSSPSDEKANEKQSEKQSKSGKNQKNKTSENSSEASEGSSEASENSSETNENSSENKNASQSSSSKSDDSSSEKTEKQKGETEDENTASGSEKEKGTKEENDEKKIKAEIEEECEITSEDIEKIAKEIETALREAECEELKNRENTSKLENFNIDSHICGHKSCLNSRVTIKDSDTSTVQSLYSEIVSKNAVGIKTLSNSFKKLFLRETEEKEHHTTGKVNLLRANNGRMSSRIFDKRRIPTDKSNTAIMILVDESGSMAGGHVIPKYVAARECCVSLAEALAAIDIPLYVIGFTADVGADVVHHHYVEWKNTKTARAKLVNISALANNADGYSIRYATQLLKKRKEMHKLLIVLSDGMPAAYCYSERNSGIADTKQAIKDAKKEFNVLGVAIGNNDTNTIHYMYESDFLHIDNVQDMFAGLSKKVADIIKKW